MNGLPRPRPQDGGKRLNNRSRTRHRAAETPRAAPPADLPRSGRGRPRARPRRASRRRSQAASKAGTPCASRPAIIPASTSPAPAVASQGGALAAMRGAAVRRRPPPYPAPLSRTTAPQRSAAAAHPLEFRAIGMLVADVAEQPRKFALMRRQNDLRVARGLDRFEQPVGRFGKARQRVGVEHEAALRRQRGEDEIAGPRRRRRRPARSRRH